MRLHLAAVLGVVVLSSSSPALAQAPASSAIESDVWAVIQEVWRLEEAGDPDAILGHYHPNWHRWGYMVADLWDRQHLSAFLHGSMAGLEFSVELVPMLVQIHGDAAIAHYVAEIVATERSSGRASEHAVRFSDFLVREAGRWQIIGGYRDDQCALSPSAWGQDWVCPAPSLDVSDGSWAEQPLGVSEMQQYVGTYRVVEDGERVDVWIEDGHLHITPGQSDPERRIQLVPMGDHVFAQGRYEDGVLREIYSPGVRVVFVEEDGVVRAYELRIGETPIEVGRRVPLE